MTEVPFKSILVWGRPGVGKSLFCWNSPLKPVLHLDFEYSTRPYRRLCDEFQVKVVDILTYTGPNGFKELYTKIPAGKYRTIALDTAWQVFEWFTQDTFARNAARAEKQVMLVWGEVRRAIRECLISLESKCDLLIMTAHARVAYNNPKQWEPRIAPTAFELIDVAIQLERDPNQRLPIGLITGRNRLHGILPPRIEPCTWQRILEYVSSPPDWENLKPEEIAIPDGDLKAISEEDIMEMA